MLIVPVLAVPGKPALVSVFEPGFAGFADGLSSSLVFVVGGEVADALVESDGVVVLADDGEFVTQCVRVADREQVRVVGLDVPEQALSRPDRLGCRAGRSAGRSRTGP